ncbi:hypothetical protein DLF91_01520 [Escherichia coli O157]|nr:hypothetical protein [Escherichia coli O157]EFO0901120.1 hypothetical protein [Escherichia coli O157]
MSIMLLTTSSVNNYPMHRKAPSFRARRTLKKVVFFVLLNLCKIFSHHKSNNTSNNTLMYHHENE